MARAFQAKVYTRGVKWAGCSAGALAAAGIALDGDFDAAIDFFTNASACHVQIMLRELFSWMSTWGRA